MKVAAAYRIDAAGFVPRVRSTVASPTLNGAPDALGKGRGIDPRPLPAGEALSVPHKFSAVDGVGAAYSRNAIASARAFRALQAEELANRNVQATGFRGAAHFALEHVAQRNMSIERIVQVAAVRAN